MRKKTRTFVPPYLDLSFRSNGENLLSVVSQAHVRQTARDFIALTTLSPSARRFAVATTLVEVARALLYGEHRDIDEHLRQATQLLIIADTPFGVLLDEDDELPF